MALKVVKNVQKIYKAIALVMTLLYNYLKYDHWVSSVVKYLIAGYVSQIQLLKVYHLQIKIIFSKQMYFQFKFVCTKIFHL